MIEIKPMRMTLYARLNDSEVLNELGVGEIIPTLVREPTDEEREREPEVKFALTVPTLDIAEALREVADEIEARAHAAAGE